MKKSFFTIACIALVAISCSKEEEIFEPEETQLKTNGVYLCFDDGPCSNTVTLVNKIKSTGATASFFIWGQRVQSYTSAMDAIKNANFSIQNHSYTHSHMLSWSYSQVYTDINNCQLAIKNRGYGTPTKYRAPYLEVNSTITSVCSALGLTIIQPTVDSKDWAGATTSQIITNVSAMTGGGNALMHDGYTTTNNAIAQIVTNLSNKGYWFARYW